MTSPAIFLSYASQDAEAARRICDALRAAGLEVWFDQSELRGGDAWDASIRKQIKECALFVPIVSANTNAREEGYFRLEWKLAVDRSHLMADNKAFFVPVLIDDTNEANAIVPDKFRERQWSRLHDDESMTKFAMHVQQILAPAGPVTAQRPPGTIKADTITELPMPIPSSRRVTLTALMVVGVTAAGGLAIWRPWGRKDASEKAPASTIRDPQLQRAIQLIEAIGAIAADVALAEDLVKTVLAARPTDVEATLVMGRVQAYYLLRGFDRSEERFAMAKRFAERGLIIAPQDPDAKETMAIYLFSRRIDLPQAAKLLREAIALRPDEPRYYRGLVNVMSVTPGVSSEQLIAVGKSNVERFPDDALTHYNLARLYRDASRVDDMLTHFDRAIALSSIDDIIVQRARYKLYLDGDQAGTKALIDRLSDRYRGTARAVFCQFEYALMSGNPAFGLKALDATPEPWLDDFHYAGPTQLLAGELQLLQGKIELARQRFEAAQAELVRHKLEPTRSQLRLWLESWLHMRLGRMQEARRGNALLVQELPRPYRVQLHTGVVLGAIRLNLLLGERAIALAIMREAAEDKFGRAIIRTTIRLDPRLARFRNDAEILALLVEPDTKK